MSIFQAIVFNATVKKESNIKYIISSILAGICLFLRVINWIWSCYMLETLNKKHNNLCGNYIVIL